MDCANSPSLGSLETIMADGSARITDAEMEGTEEDAVMLFGTDMNQASRGNLPSSHGGAAAADADTTADSSLDNLSH